MLVWQVWINRARAFPNPSGWGLFGWGFEIELLEEYGSISRPELNVGVCELDDDFKCNREGFYFSNEIKMFH